MKKHVLIICGFSAVAHRKHPTCGSIPGSLHQDFGGPAECHADGGDLGFDVNHGGGSAGKNIQ